jgi:ataxia telangiectasia mutated family protein
MVTLSMFPLAICGILADAICRFSDFENIMATRVSLIRSVRQKEERDQIGNLLSPFARGLIDVEKQCLLRLSEAARDAHQHQIALNSIVRAQRLERTTSFEVSQEFASVLWLQGEERLAVQFLKELLNKAEVGMPTQDKTRSALLLARLVRRLSDTDIITYTNSFRALGHLRLVLKNRQTS